VDEKLRSARSTPRDGMDVWSDASARIGEGPGCRATPRNVSYSSTTADKVDIALGPLCADSGSASCDKTWHFFSLKVSKQDIDHA
jgi:hypothetical protein